MPRDYEDMQYLGFVMRIYSTYAANVAVYSRNGIILANLRTVPAARKFIRGHRRLYGLDDEEVQADAPEIVQDLTAKARANGRA